MPLSIAALRRFIPALPGELRQAVTRSDKTETEAFQASEGSNASRIQAFLYGLFCRKNNSKLGAFSLSTFHADLAAMLLDYPLRYG